MSNPRNRRARRTTGRTHPLAPHGPLNDELRADLLTVQELGLALFANDVPRMNTLAAALDHTPTPARAGLSEAASVYGNLMMMLAIALQEQFPDPRTAFLAGMNGALGGLSDERSFTAPACP